MTSPESRRSRPVCNSLIDKYPPLVARLARAPGPKEARYAHLLSGEEALERQEVAASSPPRRNVAPGSRAQLEAEVARLRGEVEQLSEQFEQLQKAVRLNVIKWAFFAVEVEPSDDTQGVQP